MVSWQEFADEAPTVAGVFIRRHAATGRLCLLATLRSDGYPRISLHTATVDTQVSDGDAKLWGLARNLPDIGLHTRFAEDLYAESGLDLRGQVFDPFFVADLTGASSIEIDKDGLVITIWRPGRGERTVRKS